jgi:RNA polymerase sigma-70 factor (family 1)
MTLYDSYTDKQLIRSLKEGDANAFTEIYERYWDKVLIYTMRAIRLQPEAEDIVQELFVSIWRRRHELDIDYALSTYLYNSARYLTLRHIEQNITRSDNLRRLTEKLLEDGLSLDTEIESEIFGRELQVEIDRLVQELPEKMREIFLLSRRDHLSYRDIAAKLSLSEETVRKQIYNSLRILRSRLGSLPAALLFSIATYYF